MLFCSINFISSYISLTPWSNCNINLEITRHWLSSIADRFLSTAFTQVFTLWQKASSLLSSPPLTGALISHVKLWFPWYVYSVEGKVHEARVGTIEFKQKHNTSALEKAEELKICGRFLLWRRYTKKILLELITHPCHVQGLFFNLSVLLLSKNTPRINLTFTILHSFASSSSKWIC